MRAKPDGKLEGIIVSVYKFYVFSFAPITWYLTLLISTLVTPLFEQSENTIDCKWNEFGAWSSCSKTCGGGGKWRKRTRQRETVKGGLPCKGNKLEFAECNNQKCAGKWTSPTFLSDSFHGFLRNQFFLSYLYHFKDDKICVRMCLQQFCSSDNWNRKMRKTGQTVWSTVDVLR